MTEDVKLNYRKSCVKMYLFFYEIQRTESELQDGGEILINPYQFI